MDVVPQSPLTTVKILRGIPIDSDYRNTLTFPNTSNQYNYFNSKAKFTITEMSPVKIQNEIRVGITADKLFDCNYIMFQNANFSNKWFYAFIKEIQFINSNMSKISFEIDAFQTWFFEMNINQCFVEREHVMNDEIGVNLIDEGLETGEYVMRTSSGYGLNNPSEYRIILWCSDTSSGSWTSGFINSNIYSGVGFIAFDPNDSESVERLNNLIDTLVSQNKIESIVAITMLPLKLINTNKTPKVGSFEFLINKSDIDGYIPKNNKLFVYPYNYAILSNTINQTQELRYEYLSSNKITVNSVFSSNAEAIAFPSAYLKQGNNINYSVSLNQFPMCSYITDTYKAWLAQNQGFNLVGTATGLLTTGIGIATGNAMMVGGGLQATFNSMEQNRIASKLPSVANGNNTATALFANYEQDFKVYNMTITSYYAKKIDDFFSLYGYKVNSVKKPNITGRKYWNYVKCIDSVVTGNIPIDDKIKCQNALDNGITFWHDSNVGNYDRSNIIV